MNSDSASGYFYSATVKIYLMGMGLARGRVASDCGVCKASLPVIIMRGDFKGSGIRPLASRVVGAIHERFDSGKKRMICKISFGAEIDDGALAGVKCSAWGVSATGTGHGLKKQLVGGKTQ